MEEGPEERILAILPVPKPEKALERLQQHHPNAVVEYIHYSQWYKPLGNERDALKDVYRDCTVLVCTIFSLPESRADCPQLKIIHLFSAGAEGIINHPIFTETDITVTTSSGIHGPQIGEWFAMTLLVTNHQYKELYENEKKHEWNRSPSSLKNRNLLGQRLGVLGYGSIGRQAARIAKSMGMDVIAYTAHPKNTPSERADHGFIIPGIGDPAGTIPSAWFSGTDKASLHDFLRQDLDVLLISVPLTPATTKLISAAELAVLSHHPCVLSNVSRGQIVDQPALVQALQEGKLRAACLDVADPEPLPKDDPLWDAPNMLLTPHVSGGCAEYLDRVFMVLDENLGRWEREERLLNVVKRERGY